MINSRKIIKPTVISHDIHNYVRMNAKLRGDQSKLTLHKKRPLLAVKAIYLFQQYRRHCQLESTFISETAFVYTTGQIGYVKTWYKLGAQTFKRKAFVEHINI